MSAPVYRTVDIVAAIRAYFDVLTDDEADQDIERGGLGFMKFLADELPKAYKEDIVRAWAVYQEDFRQEQLGTRLRSPKGRPCAGSWSVPKLRPICPTKKRYKNSQHKVTPKQFSAC